MKTIMRLFAIVILIILNSVAILQAQWVHVGLQGGRIRSFTQNNQTLFAGDSGGGVFRSNDSGATWTQCNTGLSDLNITAVGTGNSKLFAATDTTGIFLSTNNGTNWTKLNNWKNTHPVIAFAIIGTTVFAGTDSSGVFRSSDDGVSWIAVNNGLTSLNLLGLVSNVNSLFVNIVNSGVFRSTDSGMTWINSSQGLIGNIDVLISSDGNLYGANRYGVYRSANQGRNWTNPNPIDTFKQGVYAIAVSDSGILIASSRGNYRTTDNGVTWIQPKTDIHGQGPIINHFAVLGSNVIAATKQGITLSIDHGATWPLLFSSILSFGPGAGQNIYCIAKIGITLFAGTGKVGLLYSNDNGVNWITGNGLSNNKVNTFANIGSNLFVGTDTGGVFRSVDNGSNWTALEGITNSYPVNALAVLGSDLFAATIGGGVFRSRDSGANWAAVNNGITSLNVYCLASNGAFLLAGSDQGGVFRSSDKGESWFSPIGGALHNTHASVVVLAMRDSTFYAGVGDFFGGSSDIYVSNDMGQSWTGIHHFSVPLKAIAATEKNIFGGCNNDTLFGSPVYSSNDQGVTWALTYEGMPRRSRVYSLVIFGDTLFAGSNNGIWKRALSEFPSTFGRINAFDLYFGDVKIGDTLCKTVEIHNIGSSSFMLEKSFSFAGDTDNYSINKNQLPATIKAGDSLGISICFHPVDLKNYFGYITWETNIASEFKNLGNDMTQLIGTGVLTSEVGAAISQNFISLSPNPTTGILSIRNAPEDLTGISILNVLGEKVMEIAAPHSADFTIDLSKLPTGIYFARFLMAGEEVITRKIIRE